MTTATDPRRMDIAGYKALLEALKDQGYETRHYADADPDARHLILRHDLDMSLQAGVETAEVEALLGLSAVYFVLLRTEMYNPFSAAAAAALDRIAALGHDIGLHLDASLYADDGALEEGARRECAALEGMTGRPVRTISFHRPARSYLGRAEPVAGRRHAYEPRFFRDMGYCSDSRGGWHHGHPLDHPAVAAGTALQLLTHPIWWTARAEASVQEKLDGFVGRRAVLLTTELQANCQTYDAAQSPFYRSTSE